MLTRVDLTVEGRRFRLDVEAALADLCTAEYVEAMIDQGARPIGYVTVYEAVSRRPPPLASIRSALRPMLTDWWGIVAAVHVTLVPGRQDRSVMWTLVPSLDRLFDLSVSGRVSTLVANADLLPAGVGDVVVALAPSWSGTVGELLAAAEQLAS